MATAAPSTALVLVTGLIALLIVVATWAISHVGVVVAHEGGHALMGSAAGGTVASIILSRGGGATSYSGVGQGGDVLATMAGYLAPPLFGLAGAVLLSTGRVGATLWASVAFLVCALLMARSWYSAFAIAATGALVFVVVRYAGPGFQTAFACTWVWYLLFGGVRSVLDLDRFRSEGVDSGSDVYHLRRLTSVPAALWVGFFGLFGFAALVTGGLIMVGAIAPSRLTP